MSKFLEIITKGFSLVQKKYLRPEIEGPVGNRGAGHNNPACKPFGKAMKRLRERSVGVLDLLRFVQDGGDPAGFEKQSKSSFFGLHRLVVGQVEPCGAVQGEEIRP